MKTSMLILAPAVGLAMIAISAQAQEYTSVDSSDVVHSMDANGNAVTTYTKYTTSSYHGQTKQDEYIQVDAVYAPVADTLYWTWSTPAPTSVSFYKAGEWTGPAQPVQHAGETMEPIVRPAAPKPPGVSHIEIINGKEVTVLPY